ncbi:cyclin-dependent kinase inhibitor 3-like [Mizuhopecten yessoensis]|uniref:protein-tyrosine-phosphatase n=1 Tax=Mizuhopecten yessoensis TaxID=6573 RepID=A0A210Q514_MIZYE|nr:cyclin-dependent kinase inhibitor 3-like [Mizuhopecten yessoensis]OWF43833.1 Cyclin-dependent kinase inhibitor 3 [Mizuhopecten yessoensis]
MKTPEKQEVISSSFDSSDEESGELDVSPFKISWLDLSFLSCSAKFGVCALPGCRFKDTWRSLENDLKAIKREEVTDVFCLCSKGELNKYRVPWLLHEMSATEITVHHHAFPDGQVPSFPLLTKIVDEIHSNLMNNKTTLIHCYGGLGRSCLVTACLMMVMDPGMEPDVAIQKVRDLRGHAAVQSVKQYNFLHDFRSSLEAYNKETEEGKRSLSR